jgi:tyrosyl-tRNA synthetase
LRQFQEFGHKAVLIIGDFTAMIGDPSGKSKTRPVLTRQEIEKNAETYFEQAGKILRIDSERLEIRYNSSWLAGMKLDELLKLAGKMTVGQMLKRDDFRKRYESESPIGLHEFLYPLVQAYDSVMIEADVELGGTDQTFNTLGGRDLQIQAGQPPQIVMIMPILVGLDGVQKMSKSLGNYVGVTDPPKLMFERIMSISDEMMRNYFTLLTDFDEATRERLLDPQATHPKQAKVTLAKEIVRMYHGPDQAEWSAEEFDRVHAKRELPEQIPEVKIETYEEMVLVRLLAQMGLVGSNSEAKRLIQQGGVRVDGEAITDPNAKVLPAPGMIVQVGRRKFAKLAV